MSIRWTPDTVELDWFPGKTQETLLKLQPGTFAAIGMSLGSSLGTQLFVKRLTARSFQLGILA